MSRRPPNSLRNTRKHSVRCIDCSTQMLPQFASAERPWTTAAVLRVPGRSNDGALCFDCGNKRRALLGLPVVQDPGELLKDNRDRRVPADQIETTRKKIRVNRREHEWTVGTLHSLIAKWKDHVAYDEYKNREMDLKKWVVIVNDRKISPEEFNSFPVADGDEISIVSGVLLHPF